MTSAQVGIAALADWVKASSTNVPTPLGKDFIVRGAYAVLVPQSLDLPPTPSDFDPRHLPLWIPADQAPPGLPPWNVGPPENQDHAAARLRHIVWRAVDRLFDVKLIGLASPAATLRSVLDAQAPGFDLATQAAIFVALWTVPPDDRAHVEVQLPRTGGVAP